MFSLDRRWEYATRTPDAGAVSLFAFRIEAASLSLDVRATRSADRASLQFTGTFTKSLADFGNVYDNKERAATCRGSAFDRKRTSICLGRPTYSLLTHVGLG